MSPTAMQTAIDPLGAFIAGGFTRTRTEANGFSLVGGRWPMPLVATRFDVLIDSGLAVVTTSRTFRNDESRSIEATITFPVPVHASLFALKVRIDDRVLDARAKRKDAAREDYEDALGARQNRGAARRGAAWCAHALGRACTAWCRDRGVVVLGADAHQY